MTQTLIQTPRHAMVVPTPAQTQVFHLHTFPIESVEDARAEFGPTYRDAVVFVLATACNECGMDNDAANTDGRCCQSCGIAGCECVLAEDGHGPDIFWCADCRPQCGGYCCA